MQALNSGENPTSGIFGQPTIETFQLGPFVVPRLFAGLWQLSSPAWGSAPRSKMLQQFQNHVDAGFTAFDMADHYGDAELLFGRFRSSYSGPRAIICATKYCVFEAPFTATKDLVREAVTQRLKNIQSDKVDLLQYYWQDYDDPQYINSLKFLQEDERVTVLGICNFDTKRLEEIIDNGINIATNQVQFSLIDTRPRYAMEAACNKHNVKLLTYGTLCGGFLADKWIGKDEPPAFAEEMTPSLRKYLEMITIWGGWSLFQILLETLAKIAKKHSVTVSNVATRWVLDFPYVGAVIIGVRMGVSEHAQENLAVYGWSLDEEDAEMVENVLKQSRGAELFTAMGDCGSEYRLTSPPDRKAL